MTRRQIIAITLFLTAFFGISILYYFAAQQFSSREALQAFIEAQGWIGIIIYLLWGTTSVVVTPLNFSIAGMAGGYIYGTEFAFVMNWICKTTGSLIAFWIAKRYGRQILRFFIEERQMAAYDRFIHSEKAILLYFALAFIPYTPSDNLPYMLGASTLKWRVFLPVTSVGTIGTSFGTAYMGSGSALKDPLFLVLFAIAFCLGMFWIHHNKKHFNLT